jgi:KaiC/GvpD/RAD55 family RecA-like ATPase
LGGGENVLLVGESGAGKTHFACFKLIPELENQGKKVHYFEDAESDFAGAKEADIVIVDEFETFFDADNLAQNHPDENPFYFESYLERVARWHQKIKEINRPLVLVLTRDKMDIGYVIKHMQETDWGLPVNVVEFRQNKVKK